MIPSDFRNIKVSEKNDINSCPAIVKAIQSAENMLKDNGRIPVRPLGTEPKIRIKVETSDELLMTKVTDELIKAVSNSMT